MKYQLPLIATLHDGWGGVSSISTKWELGEVGTLVIRACGRGWGACRAKRGVWVEKLENRAWNRELVRAAYASPRRPRWLGGTLAALLTGCIAGVLL